MMLRKIEKNKIRWLFLGERFVSLVKIKEKLTTNLVIVVMMMSVERWRESEILY